MATPTRAVPEPVFQFRPAHHQLSTSRTTTTARSTNHVHFIAHDQHRALLATDAAGRIAIWNLHAKRVQWLWHPHPNTEHSGGCLWATSLFAHLPHLFILSQGRDHRLVLTQIPNYLSTSTISTIARASLNPSSTPDNTNVITLAQASINAINFCKASSLTLSTTPAHQPNHHIHSIVALPSLITEQLVDVFAVQIVQPPKLFRIYQGLGRNGTHTNHTGSVVAVQLFTPPGASGLILLMIGFESGAVRVMKNARLLGRRDWEDARGSGGGGDEEEAGCMEALDWENVGEFKGHSEPILSLAISIHPLDPLAAIGWSVGADRNIVRYLLSSTLPPSQPSPHTESSSRDSWLEGRYETRMSGKVFETNQSGRFDVEVRTDGRVMGVYNWGGKVWLFDTRPIEEEEEEKEGRMRLRPLAVLTVATERDRRSGVLAFAPFPPPVSAPADVPNRLDSLAHLALFVASAPAGHLVAWELFPPSNHA